MASSSPPLADSLRGSVYIHQDSFAAQQEVPYVGEMCRVRDGLGGEGRRWGLFGFINCLSIEYELGANYTQVSYLGSSTCSWGIQRMEDG